MLHLGKFIRDPKGYCAKAHHDATGMWPAQHAAMEKNSAPDADGDSLRLRGIIR